LLVYYTDNFIAENGPSGFIQDNDLCFEVIDFYDDLERVKKAKERIVAQIKTISSKLIEQVESHNYNLEWNIRNKIEERSKKLHKISNVLGTSIRKPMKSQQQSKRTVFQQGTGESTPRSNEIRRL
jgi:Regulator of G protein signaling domain